MTTNLREKLKWSWSLNAAIFVSFQSLAEHWNSENRDMGSLCAQGMLVF